MQLTAARCLRDFVFRVGVVTAGGRVVTLSLLLAGLSAARAQPSASAMMPGATAVFRYSRRLSLT